MMKNGDITAWITGLVYNLQIRQQILYTSLKTRTIFWCCHKATSFVKETYSTNCHGQTRQHPEKLKDSFIITIMICKIFKVCIVSKSSRSVKSWSVKFWNESIQMILSIILLFYYEIEEGQPETLLLMNTA